MKTKLLLFVVLFLSFVMGCASYKGIGAVPMSSIKQKGLIRVENNDFVIRGFPILTKEDSQRYFDENLLSDNVLAIFLEVFNKTSSEVKVVSSELSIEKTGIQPLTADEIYKFVKREYVGKALLWMIPTAYIGGPLSVMDTYRVNKEIKADLKEKQLGKEIKSYGTCSGFIWFKIPDKISSTDKGEWLPKGMTLNVVLEELGKEKKLIELPIS